MKMYRFPSLADHKAEHDALAHKILGFRKSVAEGKLCVSASLLLFLSNWLSAHILKTDKQYSHFFNEFGLY